MIKVSVWGKFNLLFNELKNKAKGSKKKKFTFKRNNNIHFYKKISLLKNYTKTHKKWERKEDQTHKSYNAQYLMINYTKTHTSKKTIAKHIIDYSIIFIIPTI